jgi:hypothetical protein
MNEKDKYALVPKPPAALEKAEPGAKRILSCMVADTLALAKKPGWVAWAGSVFDGGKLPKVNWDLGLLTVGRFDRVSGLEITHFSIR